MGKAICSIPDCAEPVRARGWCASHYSKWRNHGDPIWEKPPYVRAKCSECDRPADGGRGWCNRHYIHWLRTGDPISEPQQPTNTYVGIHLRVVRIKGRAKDHSCVDCGEPAKQWSYDHTDPDEVLLPGGAKGKLQPVSRDLIGTSLAASLATRGSTWGGDV